MPSGRRCSSISWSYLLTLDADGAPRSLIAEGRPGDLVAYNPHSAGIRPGSVVLAPPRITMHEAVALRQKTGAPIALVEDGRLIGVVGDTEIYRGILRQTGIGP